VDADLTDQGKREIEHAARLMLERGYSIDVTYTSMLKRAIRSSWIIMKELNQVYRPCIKSWRLNERMYGALEGICKPELARELGEHVVQEWRAGLLDRPPPMAPTHIHWHKNERKYKHLDAAQIPVTESLQDTLDRTLPLWESEIKPDLMDGRNVMIVAHANSLRGEYTEVVVDLDKLEALIHSNHVMYNIIINRDCAGIVKHIDGLNTHQIQKVGIPNGIPLVYKFDKNMTPIKQPKAVSPITGEYLEKRVRLEDKIY
jgi:2,3-bisphosphoglycerate-dependent phosphoglycerate mutase